MNDRETPFEIVPIAPRRKDTAAAEPPQTDLLGPNPETAVALALIEEVRRLAEEVGRLRERLATAEQRAVVAEAACAATERARWTEAALADAFVDLLDGRLHEARRRLREFDVWLSARPPRS
jgi:hypothetical protein